MRQSPLPARGSELRVRGGATAEELAAVLSVVVRAEGARPQSAYAAWRQARLSVTRPTIQDSPPPKA